MMALAAFTLASLALFGLGVLSFPRVLIAWLIRDRGVVYFCEDERSAAALSFDDGPSPATQEILATLAEFGVRATFFLIADNVLGNEETVAQIVAEGHEIGNHMTRDYPSILLSPSAFDAELARAHDVCSQFAPVRWFRPANGIYNRRMLNTIRRFRYRCVLGDVWPIDWVVTSAKTVARYTLWRARPGSIIILHDRPGRSASSALRLILQGLRARGTSVVTVGELVARRHAGS